MNRQILDSLNSIPYFTIESVKQLWAETGIKGDSIRTALYRWMKAGVIIQLKNGVYMTRHFDELHHSDAGFSPSVSAILMPQSYISLEFVLQRHGVLTEVTYPVTAVTTKNTRVIENDLGTFSYRHIKSSLYYGFTVANYQGIHFAQASLAKALFDYLYLRPVSADIQSSSYNLVEDLRFNMDEFSTSDRTEFIEFVNHSRLLKMNRILNNLRKTVWQL